MLLALIVEDEWLVAWEIQQLVESLGLRAVCVRSVEEALQFLDRQAPTLGIVDLNLREPFDGIAVARRLDALGAKVIIASAYGRQAAGRLAGLNVFAYCDKPVDEEVCAAAIRKALDRDG